MGAPSMVAPNGVFLAQDQIGCRQRTLEIRAIEITEVATLGISPDVCLICSSSPARKEI